MKNARFWIWENCDWVKLTVRPDRPLNWSVHTPTEEGFHAEVHQWRVADGVLVHELATDGRDCDGRLQQFRAYTCPIDRLPGEPLTLDPPETTCRMCYRTILLRDGRWAGWCDEGCTSPSGKPRAEHMPVQSFNPPRVPWETRSASQRDAYAEAAGY